MKGWSKLCPGKTKRPWLWTVLAAIACLTTWLDFPEMARYWVFVVDVLGQLTETFRFRCRQIISAVRTPRGSYRRMAVHLHPDCDKIWSKTAELDVSVLLGRAEIGPIAVEECSQLGLGERLWILG